MNVRISKPFSRWWVMLIAGIVTLILGCMMVRHPFAAFETLSTLVLVNFLVIGLIQAVYIIAERSSIPNWGWRLVIPVLMVVIGIFLATVPFAKEELLCVFVGAGILIEGVSSISGAIAMRRAKYPGSVLALVLAILMAIAGVIIVSDFFLTITYITVITAVSVLLLGVDLIAGSIFMYRAKSLVG